MVILPTAVPLVKFHVLITNGTYLSLMFGLEKQSEQDNINET